MPTLCQLASFLPPLQMWENEVCLVTNGLEEQLLTELQSNPPPLETSTVLLLPEKQGEDSDKCPWGR